MSFRKNKIIWCQSRSGSQSGGVDGAVPRPLPLSPGVGRSGSRHLTRERRRKSNGATQRSCRPGLACAWAFVEGEASSRPRVFAPPPLCPFPALHGDPGDGFSVVNPTWSSSPSTFCILPTEGTPISARLWTLSNVQDAEVALRTFPLKTQNPTP